MVWCLASRPAGPWCTFTTVVLDPISPSLESATSVTDRILPLADLILQARRLLASRRRLGPELAAAAVRCAGVGLGGRQLPGSAAGRGSGRTLRLLRERTVREEVGNPEMTGMIEVIARLLAARQAASRSTFCVEKH